MRKIIFLCFLLISLNANANPLFFKSSYMIITAVLDNGEQMEGFKDGNARTLGGETIGISGDVLDANHNKIGYYYTGEDNSILYYNTRGNYMGKRVKKTVKKYDNLFDYEYIEVALYYYDSNNRLVASYLDSSEMALLAPKNEGYTITKVFIRQNNSRY